LVQIPAGVHYRKIKKAALEFGSNDLFIRDRVSIPNSFHMTSTEVTQEQWTAIMKTAPWRDRPNSREAPRQPVTYVTRQEAEEFCKRLTSMERQRGLIANSVEYRLPTEDEWEYACRAGQSSKYYGGEDVNSVATYEWCQGSGDGKLDQPKDVGLKSPTRWGVYDAFGNVREICSNYIRGGSWADPPERCSTWRADVPWPPDENSWTGFRVILTKK
jgi:formylglycine-generating enzyme required for sulfatase activity